MIDRLGEFLRRAFPGFPERYVTRIGEVVAVHDYPGLTNPGQAQASDRYRPRMAVDVQPLTPLGDWDEARPVLRGLALPHSWAAGFPEPGARVRLGYDYGDPSHPYIADVLSEGRELPSLDPRERRVDLGEGAFLRRDAGGNLRLQTNGTLTLDAARIEVITEALAETLGEAVRTVERDEAASIGGAREVQVLGALTETVGGDARRVVVGSLDTTIGGDEGRLVGGSLEVVAAAALKLTANLGDVTIESKLGAATLKAALLAKLEGLTIKIGSATVSLLDVLVALATALEAETHGTGTGPSTTPINAASYTAEKGKINTIKG